MVWKARLKKSEITLKHVGVNFYKFVWKVADDVLFIAGGQIFLRLSNYMSAMYMSYTRIYYS